MDRRRLIWLSAAGGLTALVAGCGQAPAPAGTAPAARPARVATTGPGVLDVARSHQLTSFVRAVETAGLTEQLSGAGPYTLFVPNDAAFRAARVSPTGSRDTLRRLLAYHIVPGQVNASFMTGMSMNHLTSTGDILSVDGRGGRIQVNDATLLRPDIYAGNGVIHIVDRVLRPA